MHIEKNIDHYVQLQRHISIDRFGTNIHELPYI